MLLTYTYEALFTAEDAGGYSVHVPSLPGCNTQGDTFEDAFRNTQDAIKLYLDSLRAHGDPIPRERSVAVTRVPVPLEEPAPRV